jgi:thiamine-monophosphate kinase
VTAHGFVDAESALRRCGACAGDDAWVSGTLGDAAGALAQLQAGTRVDPALRARLDRPAPRIALGRALRGIASACIDVSDGLLADLGHVCTASGVGAEIELDALPASPALLAAFDATARNGLQAGGGDDYELCITAAPGQREAIASAIRDCGTQLTRIGRIVAATGVRALRADGNEWIPERTGYVHFD